MVIASVDDILTTHDGSAEARKAIGQLRKRFPFGSWTNAKESAEGVQYCGKTVKIDFREEEEVISVGQRSGEGRLDTITVSRERARQSSTWVTRLELAEFRSAMGSLQWMRTQTRPDLAFSINR